MLLGSEQLQMEYNICVQERDGERGNLGIHSLERRTQASPSPRQCPPVALEKDVNEG